MEHAGYDAALSMNSAANAPAGQVEHWWAPRGGEAPAWLTENWQSVGDSFGLTHAVEGFEFAEGLYLVTATLSTTVTLHLSAGRSFRVLSRLLFEHGRGGT